MILNQNILFTLSFCCCRCYYHGGALGRSQTAVFTCYRPLVGRYVYVRRHGWGVLTLCEVEVYGAIGGMNHFFG